MILDSHAYCFPPGDDPAGFSSAAERLAWIQEAHGRHHQPGWRVRDRQAASSEGLRPEDPAAWEQLPDVDFRIDHAGGRVVWPLDDKDYTKQFFPANLRHHEFTPEDLIAEEVWPTLEEMVQRLGADRLGCQRAPSVCRLCACSQKGGQRTRRQISTALRPAQAHAAYSLARLRLVVQDVQHRLGLLSRERTKIAGSRFCLGADAFAKETARSPNPQKDDRAPGWPPGVIPLPGESVRRRKRESGRR